jgi:hypothetical protein
MREMRDQYEDNRNTYKKDKNALIRATLARNIYAYKAITEAIIYFLFLMLTPLQKNSKIPKNKDIFQPLADKT